MGDNSFQKKWKAGFQLNQTHILRSIHVKKKKNMHTVYFGALYWNYYPLYLKKTEQSKF